MSYLESNKEQSYIMIKPSFVGRRLSQDLTRQVLDNDLDIVCQGLKHYTKKEAEIHYSEKKGESYFSELVDYLSSDVSYGIVVEGNDAINKSRKLIERLRTEYKEKFDLKTDVMRNILHCTSKTDVDGRLVDVSSTKEINIFKNNNDQLIVTN